MNKLEQDYYNWFQNNKNSSIQLGYDGGYLQFHPMWFGYHDKLPTLEEHLINCNHPLKRLIK